MFSSTDGYPYKYKNKRQERDGAISFLRHTYTFKSERSHQSYIIEVDEFEDFLLYVVKFYLKAHRLSKDKFQHQTGLNEAASCISTCINVMIDLHQKNPYRSFAFIGAASANELKSNTKRFLLYKKIMEAVFSPTTFEHFQHPSSSAYLMLNKLFAKNNPDLRERIEAFFLQHYDLILSD